jgi:hypothetical protein
MQDFKKIKQKHTVFTHLCHTHFLHLTTTKYKFTNEVLTKSILSRIVHPHLLQGTTILMDQDTVKLPHKKITVYYIKCITWHMRFTATTTKTPAFQNVTVYSLVVVPWHSHGVICQENSNLVCHVFLLPSMLLNFRQNKCHSPLLQRSNASMSQMRCDEHCMVWYEISNCI